MKADICIIGAGAGGLSVAAGAAQMGARTVLIEAGEMGGDCLNTGCVPSKALLHAGKAGMGWEAAQAHVRHAIAAIAPHDSQARFEGLGVEVLRGFARFTGRDRLRVGDTELRARRFVIATGSRPFIPPIPGLDGVPYLTNETLFGLEQKPKHLLILGAGPVGVEMAMAHVAQGCRVTLIDAAQALGREDPDAAALVLARLREAGVTLHENTRVGAVRAGITLETDAGEITGTHLLVATGRVPVVEGLGLEAAGVRTTPQGIAVDARLRTSNRRIYAIGDVTGGAQFTHVAGYQAGVVLRSAMFGLRARVRTDHIPRVTYTAPELAQVGLTESQARAAHPGVEVFRVEVAGNDRAVTAGDTTGFLKLMVVRGRPMGVTIVADDAGEQIALWALALANRLKLSAIAGTVLPYPTRAEISKRAAGAWFSPRLFESPIIKRVVRAVQRLVP